MRRESVDESGRRERITIRLRPRATARQGSEHLNRSPLSSAGRDDGKEMRQRGAYLPRRFALRRRQGCCSTVGPAGFGVACSACAKSPFRVSRPVLSGDGAFVTYCAAIDYNYLQKRGFAVRQERDSVLHFSQWFWARYGAAKKTTGRRLERHACPRWAAGRFTLQNAPRRKPSGAALRGVLQEAHGIIWGACSCRRGDRVRQTSILGGELEEGAQTVLPAIGCCRCGKSDSDRQSVLCARRMGCAHRRGACQ